MTQAEIKNFYYLGKRVPTYMQDGVLDYINEHRPPGAFLRAVLGNDLIQACHEADVINQKLLPVYVAFLCNRAPDQCWGSSKKVDAWLAAANTPMP